MASSKSNEKKGSGAGTTLAQGKSIKIEKKRVKPVSIIKDEPKMPERINEAKEILKITVSQNNARNYDVNADFDNGENKNIGELTEPEVQNFADVFSEMAKQALPNARTPLPRPPKFIEITLKTRRTP